MRIYKNYLNTNWKEIELWWNAESVAKREFVNLSFRSNPMRIYYCKYCDKLLTEADKHALG
jgi:hypothetical protein